MLQQTLCTPSGQSMQMHAAIAALPGLAIALDGSQMKRKLDPIVQPIIHPGLQAANGDRQPCIQEIDSEIIQFRPERCVIRYRLQYESATTGRSLTRNVIGKVSQAGEGRQIHRAMTALWAHAFKPEHSEKIRIPEPLAFLPDLEMVVQEEVPGHHLNDLIKRQPQPEYARLIARVLIKLHTAEVDLGRTRHMADHLRRCYPSYTELARACPELSDPIRRIADAASELDVRLDRADYMTIHGDFHMKQIHVADERSWLLDFDALSHGDPAADLGNVIVTLRHKADRLGNVPELIDALIDEYCQVMNPDIAKRIPIYEAVNGLRRACKQLRLEPPGWRMAAQQMVAQALGALDHTYNYSGDRHEE